MIEEKKRLIEDKMRFVDLRRDHVERGVVWRNIECTFMWVLS